MDEESAMQLAARLQSVTVVAALLVGAAIAGQARAQTAGVIQFVAGNVTLVAEGSRPREARKGVPVSVGDTLATTAGALVQIKMGDGAIVVVQPESRLTVAEFHYAGREDGSEKVRYRLEQGGFRAVTGAIGRTHKKNYLIETPVAHMGVRGTDHESYYFPAAGPVGAEDAKPGAYNKVNTGRTFMRTNAGEVEIEPNEVGFVASAADVPVILPRVPGFFNRSVGPRNARPAVTPAPESAQVAQVKQTVQSAEGQNLVPVRGPGSVVGTGNGRLVAYAVSAGRGSTTFGRSGNGVTVALLGGAALMGSGGNNSVNWASWQGGQATIVGGSATVGLVHVIQSAELTTVAQLSALPASLVTASYSYTGGPAPTNGLGVAGTIHSLQVDVNFAKQQITNYSVQASALASWTASGSGSIASFTGPTGIALNGTCMGCNPGMGPGAAASGTAHGAFVGAQAEQMITTFGLSAGGKSISGAAHLQR